MGCSPGKLSLMNRNVSIHGTVFFQVVPGLPIMADTEFRLSEDGTDACEVV